MSGVCVFVFALNVVLFSVVGGLAVEEPRQLPAWGPGGSNPDPKEAPPEHSHLHPGPAEEYEMEAFSSASERFLSTSVTWFPH